MAGRGPTPKVERRNESDVPIRGEWQRTAGSGWRHGDPPKPPTGLKPAAREAWVTWMGAWFASHWTPEDLPILRQIIKLYDKADRDEASAAELTQFRQLLDSYGITPKGQQDRRWAAPKDDEQPAAATETPAAGPYANLRVIKSA